MTRSADKTISGLAPARLKITGCHVPETHDPAGGVLLPVADVVAAALDPSGAPRDGVDPARLDPILTTFDRGRQAQKAKYGGELFFADAAADPAGTRFVDFFADEESREVRERAEELRATVARVAGELGYRTAAGVYEPPRAAGGG
jgi:hypothetical protein